MTADRTDVSLRHEVERMYDAEMRFTEREITEGNALAALEHSHRARAFADVLAILPTHDRDDTTTTTDDDTTQRRRPDEP